jgi:hypothetical protein
MRFLFHDDKYGMLKFFLAVVSIVLALPLLLLYSWVGVHLWTWFAVPLGAPVIPIEEFYGMSLLVKYFTYTFEYNSGRDIDSVGKMWFSTLMFNLFFPLITLVTGYLVHNYWDVVASYIQIHLHQLHN